MPTQAQAISTMAAPVAADRCLADRLRSTVSLSLAASAGIHALLAPHHADHSLGSGVSMGLAAASMGVTAVVVALCPSRAAVTAAALMLGGAMLLYAAAMFVPVPVVAPHVEAPTVVGITAKAVELTGLVAAVWLLLVPTLRTAGSQAAWMHRLLPVGAAAVAAAYLVRMAGH